MSFNGSGTYVPPAGQPVAAGTVIQSSTFNTLVTDIGNTFNNTLPRDGQAAMAAQLKLIDGTSSVPGIAFNSEASTGMYHPTTGALALVASGVESLRVNSAGRVLVGTTTDDGSNKLQVNGNIKVTGALSVTGAFNVSGASTAASYSGPLTGNVTGNLTGNVTGNVSGTSANVTGTVAVANGGTGATTASAALTNLNAVANVITLPDTQDLNAVVTSGFYRVGASPVNAPAGASPYSQLIVSRGSDTVTQIYGSYSNGEVYTRSGNPSSIGGSGTWSAWAKQWSTANLTKLSQLTNDPGFAPSASPSFTGDIQQTNAAYLKSKLANGTVTRLFGLNASNTLYIGSIDTTAGDTLFMNGTEQMRIAASGNVLIGTATDDGVNKLKVNGPGAFSLPAGSGTPTIALNQVSDDPVVEMQRWSGTGSNYAGNRIKNRGGDLTIETAPAAAVGSQTFTERLRVGASGVITVPGTRTMTYDAGLGALTIKGNPAGWATGFQFQGSGGTNYGGFYGYGSADAMNWYAVGDSYQSGWLTVFRTGRVAVGTITDDGVNKFQVNGTSAFTGDLHQGGGPVFFGGAQQYTSFASAVTVNYPGNNSQYGITMKPASSTATTNAIAFLNSSSTAAGPNTTVGSIQHLASDAGMNLTGTWSYGGNPIATTNAPNFTGAVSATGAITANSSSDGAISIANDSNGSIEIGKLGRASSGTPYIDFHSSANSPDYDSRIMATGGSSTAGSGTLTLVSGTIQFSTGGTPKITIDNPGNLGLRADGLIGAGNGYNGNTTASSSATLQLYSAADGMTRLTNSYASGAIILSAGGSERLRVTAAGVIQDGSGNELGYKDAVQNVIGASYTLAVGDRGKSVVMNAASSAVTVPASVFGGGATVTIYNNSGAAQTIVQGSGITVKYGTGATPATGNRTLANNGLCTLYFLSGTIAILSGNGLT